MDFVVAGHTYRARRMDAKTQLKITKKIAPLIGAGFAEAMDVYEHAKTMEISVTDPKTGEVTTLRGMAAFFNSPATEILGKIAPPLLQAFAKIDDGDLDFIIARSLNLCDRFVAPNKSWAPVWNEAADRSMFDDIDFSMPTQLQIVWAVLREPMIAFFSAAPSSSNDGATTQPTMQ